jgi:hypothetical protein
VVHRSAFSASSTQRELALVVQAACRFRKVDVVARNELLFCFVELLAQRAQFVLQLVAELRISQSQAVQRVEDNL